MTTLRLATPDDRDEVLPRARALNAQEGIEISDAALDGALRRLLGEPALGGAWLVVRAGCVVGYAIVTYGFDLEYGGRDAYLTEIWIDAEHRGTGAGTAALELLGRELQAREVHALHLMVRPENPARRLYERNGFVTSPRLVMTRRLD